jgi:CheY-like chemotaxis protein
VSRPALLDGIHVLVVEDDPDQRDVLATLLQQLGAVVSVTAAAEPALEDLTQFVPDVTLSDLDLPGIDGIAFVQKLRSVEGGLLARVPVIAITGHYERLTAEHAQGVGFAALLRKPVRVQDLCETVRRAVGVSGTATA